ncbi:MAG: cellulase family glycosylhydrolase [Actinomycetia bacterium]|nr:cellulase family glycosylhydrolase [Actinomycetes bacterium]
MTGLPASPVGRTVRAARSGRTFFLLTALLAVLGAACAASAGSDSGLPAVPGAPVTTVPLNSDPLLAAPDTGDPTPGASIDALAGAPPDPGSVDIDPEAVGFSPGSMVLDLSPEALNEDLDRMVELGAQWIRLDFDWSRIEAERGRFDWSTTDERVIAARRRGLRVLGVLAYTPAWAREDQSSDKAPPDDFEDFSRFATAAVTRYGEHVRAWEVWNEPNVATFWHPHPDPQAYGKLLEVAATAVRSVDRDALIISGGLAPAVDVEGSELSPETFLERLYESVPSGSFDAVGVHPYTYPGFPTDDQPWNTFARLPELRAVMIDHGDDRKRLWITEYGAPTGAADRAVSEDDQARMVAEAIIETRDLPWVGPLFVYALRDHPEGRADDIEAHFGVLRADGAEKVAAAELARLLDG